MTIKSHHNLKRLDDEGLLVGTPHIYESTVGSSRLSGPHQFFVFFVFKANGRAPSGECNARQTLNDNYSP